MPTDPTNDRIVALLERVLDELDAIRKQQDELATRVAELTSRA